MLERSTTLLLVAAVLALALAACSEPAAQEPAACTGASCEGGGGGSGGAPGCPDHTAASPCHFDGPGDSCGALVCALASRSCPDGGHCCVLPLECADRVGDFAGGTTCETDDECASGLCLEVAGAKSCHRACVPGSGTDSCPTGQHCSVVALTGGATTTTCLGGTSDAPDPDATVCTKPSQCPAGRTCRIVDAPGASVGVAVPLCLPTAAEPDWLVSCAPPAGSDPLSPGLHGTAGSALCGDHGLCYEGCREDYSDACVCSDGQLQSGTCRGLFCTGLCGRDEDCPERTRCQALRDADIPFQDPQLVFSICRLPPGQPLDWGCWDELDCCKDGLRNKGLPCCNQRPGGCVNPAVPADETHCRVILEGERYLTVCMLPEGRGALGASCTGHDGCESGLCVEDPARGPVCASPCDLRFDRCPDVEAGTTCCLTPVQLPDGAECVPACRTSCESPAACAP